MSKEDTTLHDLHMGFPTESELDLLIPNNQLANKPWICS